MIISTSVTAGVIRAIGPLMVTAAKSSSKSIKESFTNWTNTNKHEEVAATLLKTGIVKTIWSGGKDIFIKDFYYPSKITYDGSTQPIDHIDQLPAGNIIIEGIVGQGKSIFMRYLACSAISPNTKNYIPAFIELQKVSKEYPIHHALEDTLGFLGLTANNESIQHLASKGHLALLLDGFDEIPENYTKQALLDIDKLQKKYPKTKIIVSSRPLSGIQNVVGFSTCNLSPLTDSDYLPFLSKLKLDAVKKENVHSAISSSSESIIELISTPLMLTLVVWVYESEQEIPSTLKDFFEKLFHVVFTRHDSLKAGFSRQHYSGLSESKLQSLFEAFCFVTVQNKFGRTLNRAQFNLAFREAIEYTDGCDCDVDNFRKDIVKVACLMLDEGIDLTTFLHKSILDYFAAAFIIHDEEDLAEDFYAEAFNNYSTWKHSIEFLAEADKYRYSKYYILNNLPRYTKMLNTALSSEEDEEVFKFILKTTKGSDIVVTKSQGFTGWRNKDTENNEFAQATHRRLMIHLGSHLDESSLNVLTPQLQDTLNETELFHLPVRTIMSHFGGVFLRHYLRAIETDLLSVIDTANQVINLQTKKKKLFGNKIKNRQKQGWP